MEQTNEQYSGEGMVQGLKAAEAAVLTHLFAHHKQAVVKTVAQAGGSYADGNVFFQVALVEAWKLLRSGFEPGDLGIDVLLQHLAVTHFQDWRAERGQSVPETVLQAFDDIEHALPQLSPAESTLTRKAVTTLRRFESLPSKAQDFLRMHYTQGKSIAEIAAIMGRSTDFVQSGLDAAIVEFNQLLLPQGEAKHTGQLPEWAESALRDAELCHFWEQLRQVERSQETTPAGKSNTVGNKTIRWAFAALLLLTVGYFAYQRWFGPKPPAEVYKENFDPPKSLIEDINRRNAAIMAADPSAERGNNCDMYFQEADLLYTDGQFEAVRDVLFGIAEDTSTNCQSDAWFYLGIIALRLEEPGSAIECFAKIEDLAAFGEDIYWYQSLAFVKAAARNPLMKERSARAVERSLGNIIDPERKKRAEEMLRELQQ